MRDEALYERYKDALKRGHVASLRGRIDEALAAYADAARIAPERSTPHTSAGTALMRRKRPADALRQYEAALRIAPNDEAALIGRSQALVALDRRAEAADAFDALADAHATTGRLADAIDAARRGLELAEGRHRRRTLEALIEQLRASEPGEPGRVALERALRVLEGPALQSAPVVPPAEPAADAGSEPGVDAAQDLDDATAVPAEPGLDEASAGPPEAQPEPVVPGVLARPTPDGADLASLLRAAEAGLESGDPSAPERFLDLAAASLREGMVSTALDACYQALSVDPDDAGLHLALVELYDHVGWTAMATEKLDLLARLVDLDADPDAGERIAAARAARR